MNSGQKPGGISVIRLITLHIHPNTTCIFWFLCKVSVLHPMIWVTQLKADDTCSVQYVYITWTSHVPEVEMKLGRRPAEVTVWLLKLDPAHSSHWTAVQRNVQPNVISVYFSLSSWEMCSFSVTNVFFVSIKNPIWKLKNYFIAHAKTKLLLHHKQGHSPLYNTMWFDFVETKAHTVITQH